MKPSKILRVARRNPAGLKFANLCKLAESFGFTLQRQRGSHRVYTHDGIKQIMNFQNDRGMAKAYQVRQLLACVEQNNLPLEEK